MNGYQPKKGKSKLTNPPNASSNVQSSEKLYLCDGKKSCNTSCGCYKNGGECYSTTDYKFSREKALKDIFLDIEDGSKDVIDSTINDLVFLEKQIAYLKTLPFIRIDSKNPAKQVQTPAAKLFKELSQSKDGKVKILLTVINRTDTAAVDELLKKLSEFE